MAHKKAVGSVNNIRDSRSKRLGVKKFWGEVVLAGNILIRQKGNKFWPGNGVNQGKDFTLYAGKDGKIVFYEKRKLKFNGSMERKRYIKVI